MFQAQERTLAGFSLITAVILLVVAFMISTPASAHGPKGVDLQYEASTQTLSVTITHSVKNPAKHYIEDISISVNGERVSQHEYKSQPGKDTFTLEYKVPAKDGDTIKVKAGCNYFGSKSAELTVGK